MQLISQIIRPHFLSWVLVSQQKIVSGGFRSDDNMI